MYIFENIDKSIIVDDITISVKNYMHNNFKICWFVFYKARSDFRLATLSWIKKMLLRNCGMSI